MELKVNQYLDVITMCFPIGDLLPEGINGPVSIATAGLMKDFKTSPPHVIRRCDRLDAYIIKCLRNFHEMVK